MAVKEKGRGQNRHWWGRLGFVKNAALPSAESVYIISTANAVASPPPIDNVANPRDK